MSDTPAEALVYLTYARADLARVEPVVEALRKRGLNVAFDTRAHGSGNSVQESLQVLRRASTLVVFYSQATARSTWIDAEIRAFQAQLVADPVRSMAIARLDATPLPPSIAALPAIDVATATSAAAAADAIIRAINQPLAEPKTDSRPASTTAAARRSIGIDLDEISQVAESLYGALQNRLYISAELVALASRFAEIFEDLSGFGAEASTSSQRLEDFIRHERALDMETESLLIQLQGIVEQSQQLLDMMGDGGSGGWGGRTGTRTATEEKSTVQTETSTPSTPSPDPSPPVASPSSPDASPSLESKPDIDAAPQPQPATSPTPPPGALERVTFTAYHPREAQLQQWQPLVVYLSLDDPATMAQVGAAAAERLAGKLNQFRPGRSDMSTELGRGAKLRIIPSAPGFQFNPDYLDITWQEDVQQHEFRMRAESAKPGQSVNGVVQFYHGIVLRAAVPISMFIGQTAARLDSPDAYQQAIARAYRRIFASYSHTDTPIVESCEATARTMGDEYLRDVNLLQAGTEWDPRLIQAINDADIFQLFWSRRASSSPYVEREWRHALQLLPTRPNFIRPVYWSRRLHPVPAELSSLHFQPLNLSSVGWGRARTMLYGLRNR